jgi:hypothetical protein
MKTNGLKYSKYVGIASVMSNKQHIMNIFQWRMTGFDCGSDKQILSQRLVKMRKSYQALPSCSKIFYNARRLSTKTRILNNLYDVLVEFPVRNTAIPYEIYDVLWVFRRPAGPQTFCSTSNKLKPKFKIPHDTSNEL